MKKFLLLVFAMVLTSTFAWSEVKQLVEQPVVVGSNVLLKDASIKPSTETVSKFIPYQNSSSSQIIKIMQADEYLENYGISFNTRVHPYPEDPNTVDTARIIVNQLDPTNSQDWIWAGDTQIPIQVNGGEYYLNAYIQLVPSLNKLSTAFKSGSFTIDSVRFFIHTFNSQPAKKGLYFSMINANFMNLTNIGSNDFDPNTIRTPWDVIENNLTNAAFLSANKLNTTISDGKINATTMDFSMSELSDLRDYKINDDMMILLWKEEMADITDYFNLIGAWEWGLSPQRCLAASIQHYDSFTKKDTILFLNRFVYNRDTTTQEFKDFKAKYPTYAYERTIRKNYSMVVFGRFTGEFDANSVEELTNYAESFELYPNTPNPVNSTTKIKFDIKQSSFVTLKVYNQIGEEVADLVSKFMDPGQYEANFDAASLPAGSYFYSISTGKFNKTLPMIIVK